MSTVYFDHQSATPLRPEVLAAMQPCCGEMFGSPSSLHQAGLAARDALARARAQVAAFVHAESPEDIIFTSDGTEAANLAVKGTAFAQQRRGNHIVVSAVEHPAVLESVEFLEKHGFRSTKVKVDGQGRIEPDAVREAVTDKTILIAVQHANPDIGTMQPVREIGELAAERGIPFFVDAEASAGWLPLDVAALGASLLSFSPHRFGGPKGVGILYRHRGARLESLIHGGAQEGGRRAGLENVPGIVGAGVAAEIAAREGPARAVQVAQRQARLWEGVRSQVRLVKLNGPPPGPARLPNSLSVSVEFVEGEGLLLLLDTRGIAVASGQSCVSKALQVSPVLKAIGLDHALGQSTILISLGQQNSDADVDRFLEVFPPLVAKLRAMSPAWDDFQSGRIDSVIEPRG